MKRAAEIVLVTGPARSGKSEWAESLAAGSDRVAYIATARRDPADADWEARLRAHAARRPPTWDVREVPVDLPAAIATFAAADTCLLIDSLGTWTANLLDWETGPWQEATDELLCRLQERSQGPSILVAEETGWGVVPAYPAGRHFRDRLGGLIRQVAACAHRTYLVAGGHALDLSRLGTQLPPKLEKL